MIVVDTNVASELMRPSPAPVVRDWVLGQDGRDLCTTAITVAEIGYGIERLPGGRRKDALRAALADVFGMFDEQIAAICRARGAALATRNLADFQGTGVELINPWHYHG